MFARSFPTLRSAAAYRASAAAATVVGTHASLSPAALAEPRRHHTKATHPLHLLRRHNELSLSTGSHGETSPLPPLSCGCGGCPPSPPSALAVPSNTFSTTAPKLPHRRSQTVSEARVESEVASFVGGRLVQSLQREQPPRGSGIQPLLDYNKQWANEISRLNPEYFSELAKQQTPQYLWIGCSDSRVPANEIVGLYPGDVFVHRNIANIVCNSDLNALAVLQYAIDCLKVEHVIVSGHYKCGGVTAALNDSRVGLADHWILHVGAVKKRHWKRMMSDIPLRNHLDALCELNVIASVEHIVETHLVQRVWTRQNAEDAAARREGRPSKNRREDEVDIHGWVYGLEDGVVRPLLTLNRRSNVEKELLEATNALFWRYGQL